MDKRAAEPVICEKQGSVAKITINRPEKRNSINAGVVDGIIKIMKELETDPAIKVVTLTGAGDIAWMAGMEFDYLSGIMTNPNEDALEMNNSLRDSSKIVIAVVNGFCLGGGVTVLLSCDLAIAADKAQIGLPEIFRGFPPRYVCGALFRAIPVKPAMEMLVTGRNLSAGEAQQLGLVNRVVPAAELQSAAQAWAEEIGRWDGMTLKYCKLTAYKSMDEASYANAIKVNMAVQDEHNAMNPRAGEGLQQLRKAKAAKK